jgi:hypothetical protein
MKRVLARRTLVELLKGAGRAAFQIPGWAKGDTLVPQPIWARLMARAARLPAEEPTAVEVRRRIAFLDEETCRVDWNGAVTAAYAKLRAARPELAEEDVEIFAFALGHGAIVALEPGRKGPEIPGVTYERWGAIDESDEDGG